MLLLRFSSGLDVVAASVLPCVVGWAIWSGSSGGSSCEFGRAGCCISRGERGDLGVLVCLDEVGESSDLFGDACGDSMGGTLLQRKHLISCKK